jgi:hypothetical protein
LNVEFRRNEFCLLKKITTRGEHAVQALALRERLRGVSETTLRRSAFDVLRFAFKN